MSQWGCWRFVYKIVRVGGFFFSWWLGFVGCLCLTKNSSSHLLFLKSDTFQVQDETRTLHPSFTSKYSLYKYSVIRKSTLPMLPLAFQRRSKSCMAEMSVFTKYFIFSTWPLNSGVKSRRTKIYDQISCSITISKVSAVSQLTWVGLENHTKTNICVVSLWIIYGIIMQWWYELKPSCQHFNCNK